MLSFFITQTTSGFSNKYYIPFPNHFYILNQMAITKIACMMVLCMVVVTPYVEAAVTCSEVVSNLMPCLSYLKDGVGPDANCCNGVKSVNALAQTTPDRQAACKCIKSASGSYGVGASYAASLPSACGVNIPYKISPNTDCDKVQ